MLALLEETLSSSSDKDLSDLGLSQTKFDANLAFLDSVDSCSEYRRFVMLDSEVDFATTLTGSFSIATLTC